MNSNLDLNDIKSLRVAHKSTRKARVKSLDFYKTGESLIFNTNEEINLLRLEDERVSQNTISLIKHGCGLSIFHKRNKVIHTSYKFDYSLRLLDLVENKYIVYFPGHSEEVESVDAISNYIASGSADTTARLWDPRDQKSLCRLAFPSTPLVAFHPSGNLLAIAHSSHIVQFRDLRNMESVTEQINLVRVPGVDWTSIKFSIDSTMLLCTTNSSLIVVIDVMTKLEKLNLRDFDNKDRIFINACCTPESEFILSGSCKGSIPVWHTKSPLKVHTIQKYKDFGICRNVEFNPQYVNMATVHDTVHDAGSIVSLWI